MKTTYSISQAQANLPRVVKEAEDKIISLTRRGEVVSYVVSRDKMEAIFETMDIMANPEAMKAIQEDRAGKTKFYPLSCLDED